MRDNIYSPRSIRITCCAAAPTRGRSCRSFTALYCLQNTWYTFFPFIFLFFRAWRHKDDEVLFGQRRNFCPWACWERCTLYYLLGAKLAACFPYVHSSSTTLFGYLHSRTTTCDSRTYHTHSFVGGMTNAARVVCVLGA